MSISQMRTFIKRCYNSPRWTKRVDRMPDHQVFAVYSRLAYKTTITTLRKEK